MKKLILFLFLIFTLTIFSAQKSGIEKYDNLKYSDGETILYFNNTGNTVSQNRAVYERKVFSQGDDVYIVVDYNIKNKEPMIIFETKKEYIKEFEPSNENILNVLIMYNQNGYLAFKGVFQGDSENGTITLYDEKGVETETITVKDGKTM